MWNGKPLGHTGCFILASAIPGLWDSHPAVLACDTGSVHWHVHLPGFRTRLFCQRHAMLACNAIMWIRKCISDRTTVQMQSEYGCDVLLGLLVLARSEVSGSDFTLSDKGYQPTWSFFSIETALETHTGVHIRTDRRGCSPPKCDVASIDVRHITFVRLRHCAAAANNSRHCIYAT